MSDLEFITVDRDGSVITITLANAAKRNVLALPTMREITAALEAAGASDALAVVIAAEGPVFSAGHNFGDMLGSSEDEARELFDVCTNMMTLVQRLPQVVVAKVHALATAAGCQLVASCDLAVAAESASFQAPGGKGGLFCHTPMVAIARAVGRKKGLEMALTGDPIDARTACDWGLVNRVVPDDELDAATADLVARATRGSAASKAAGKEAYYAQVDMDQGEAYDFASGVMAAGAVSPDGQEGIASFVEKRRPDFAPPVGNPGPD
ncbi:MAG: enoyl-CoA hydratase-related protein [Acidimicrobiales bacterium]|nr:enoyl-CoA hydratase-related protein [Acidimicrobiales bacterium]